MGQACQNCFGESPVQVNDGLAMGADKDRKAKMKAITEASTVATEMDGYHTGAITNTYAGINKADPNYSSKDIGIEDFQIIKVIGRGSFGKVYLVQKKDD